MKSIAVVPLIVTAALFSGCASTNVANQPQLTGKVEAIYVEYMPRVFVDSRLAPPDMRGRLWADVALDEPAPNGQTVARAYLGHQLDVVEGDTVRVAMSDNANASPTIAAPHEIVAVMERQPRDVTAGRKGLQRVSYR